MCVAPALVSITHSFTWLNYLYLALTCNSLTGKALDIIERLKQEGDSSVDIVISADTIVVCDNKILEKPSCNDSAISMLKMLSGRTHSLTHSLIHSLTHSLTHSLRSHSRG